MRLWQARRRDSQVWRLRRAPREAREGGFTDGVSDVLHVFYWVDVLARLIRSSKLLTIVVMLRCSTGLLATCEMASCSTGGVRTDLWRSHDKFQTDSRFFIPHTHEVRGDPAQVWLGPQKICGCRSSSGVTGHSCDRNGRRSPSEPKVEYQC